MNENYTSVDSHENSQIILIICHLSITIDEFSVCQLLAGLLLLLQILAIN